MARRRKRKEREMGSRQNGEVRRIETVCVEKAVKSRKPS